MVEEEGGRSRINNRNVVGDRHLRSIAKTATWRLTALTSDIIIVYLLTHQVVLSALIGGITGVVKLFTFYGHERIWDRIGWGSSRNRRMDERESSGNSGVG